jgi:hypothetical protein
MLRGLSKVMLGHVLYGRAEREERREKREKRDER